MNVVELFAGIGGFRLAAESHGWRTVWANDLCPSASAVYRSNFSGTFREGDLAECLDDVPRHDLLTAGFPCQPFSAAGKKRGIRDPRGTLFHLIVRVLERRQPQFFVLENVKRLLTMERGFHFATVLASLAETNYRLEWRLLNAVDFSLPQNRERVFVLGIREDIASRPTEHGTRLASADEVAHGLSEGAADDFDGWTPIERHGRRFPKWGRARAGRFQAADLDGFFDRQPAVRLREVLQRRVAAAFDFTEATQQWLGRNTPVNRFVHGVEILSNQAGGARMGYTIFGIDGVAPTLTSTTSRHYERYRIGNRYRRLTNIEYARIQGFPDDHCRAVSVYDQYALFGNAVPPPMAAWVLGRVSSEPTRDSFTAQPQAPASQD